MNPSAADTLPLAPIGADDATIRRYIRRPQDAARFIVATAVAGGILLIAWFATGTAAGLETDVSTGASRLPGIIVLVLNVISGIGSIGLPIAASVVLAIRRRLRQLAEALAAGLVATIALTVASALIADSTLLRLQAALAGASGPGSATTAPIIGGLIAFITVTRLMSSRPWNVIATVVIGSVGIVTLLSSTLTLAAIGISAAVGWAIGLLARFAFGTPTTRPTTSEIAAALASAGLPVITLTAGSLTRRGRRYRASMADGQQLRIVVLDRDLEGAGLLSSLWRALRLRDEGGTGAFNLRRTVDHAALMAYADRAAGVRAPELLLATQIGPDAALLAYRLIDGISFDRREDVTDADCVAAWREVAALHKAQVSHRALSADHLMRSADGNVWLVGGDAGSVAASDVAMRIDLAELLCTLSLLVGTERAIATAASVIGDSGLARALPALQPVALSSTTRSAMRKHRELMVELRDAIITRQPNARSEQIKLERLRPRTLIMIIVGTIAGYVLVSQLADVDLATLLTTARWGWIAVALLLTIVTYFGAAWSLSGFVPEPIRLHHNIMAQLAGGFATLVSPPTIGSVAINVRFLQRSGLSAPLAAASVGVSQVFAFVLHIILLLAFGIAAGTQADLTFNPPRLAVIAVIVLALVALGLIAIPAIRRLIVRRIGPTVREVGPRIATVAQRPLKLLEGVGGALLLNLAYIGVLAACVAAFGGELNLALIAVVYLAGATLGQAAPTPGGMGAVEAALAAGLTAAGLDGGIAVSAVLLYRLVTFWLTAIPGYWAFTWLTRRGAL